MKGLAISALAQYYQSRPGYQAPTMEENLIQFGSFLVMIAIMWLTLYLMISSETIR